MNAEHGVPRLDLAPRLKRPLQLWNPLDYLRLLYWVFFFPQALRWYVEAFAAPERRKAIGRDPKLGTLQVGAPADVSILDHVEGPVSFVDTRGNKREGKAHLRPVQTVMNGVPFGRPYQPPFAVR